MENDTTRGNIARMPSWRELASNIPVAPVGSELESRLDLVAAESELESAEREIVTLRAELHTAMTVLRILAPALQASVRAEAFYLRKEDLDRGLAIVAAYDAKHPEGRG